MNTILKIGDNIILRDVFTILPARVSRVLLDKIELVYYDQFGRGEKIVFTEMRSTHYVHLASYEGRDYFGYLGSGMTKYRLNDLFQKIILTRSVDPDDHVKFLEENFDVGSFKTILTESEILNLQKYGCQMMAVLSNKIAPKSPEQLRLVKIHSLFFHDHASKRYIDWCNIRYPSKYSSTIQLLMNEVGYEDVLITAWVKIILEVLWERCVYLDKKTEIRWNIVECNYVKLAMLGSPKAMIWADKNLKGWRDREWLDNWINSLVFRRNDNIFGNHFFYSKEVRG
jgi:hypothetical protein